MQDGGTASQPQPHMGLQQPAAERAIRLLLHSHVPGGFVPRPEYSLQPHHLGGTGAGLHIQSVRFLETGTTSRLWTAQDTSSSMATASFHPELPASFPPSLHPALEPLSTRANFPGSPRTCPVFKLKGPHPRRALSPRQVEQLVTQCALEFPFKASLSSRTSLKKSSLMG